MPPRTPYTKEVLEKAIEDILNSLHTVPSASIKYDIPARTLRDRVAKAKNNETTLTTMGPKPVLPLEVENDIVAWILAMEQDGRPVTRGHIIMKANEAMEVMHGYNEPRLTAGWYQRFRQRHPELKTIKATTLSKTRNAVTEEKLKSFYEEVLNAVLQVDFDPSRIYNMDETSFSPSKTARKVVVHASTQTCTVEESAANSHITVIACVLADGRALPPLFVLPGETIQTNVCDGLVVPGAAITTSKKGWTNAEICRKWIKMLNDSIPTEIKRPVLLILDGCSAHYSDSIFEAARTFQILLLFLPANATHVLQPLDVTIFRPFKQAVREQVFIDAMWNPSSSISKRRAVAIACSVWSTAANASTIANGFFTTGLYPPSLEKMLYRLSLFKPSLRHVEGVDVLWIRRREEVRENVLLLPPCKKSKSRKRKTYTVHGKLITAEYHALIQSQYEDAGASDNIVVV